MLLWLLPAALAGSLVEEMDAIVLARQPALAMACSPTSAVLAGLDRLSSLPILASKLGNNDALAVFSSPERLAELGVPEDGIWSLVLLPMEISVDIPFTGTANNAEALLGDIADEGALRRTKEGWTLDSGMVSGEARLDKGALLLDISAPWLRLPGGVARASLLKGLPEVDGCLVYASIAKPPAKVPVDGLALQIPTSADMLQLRVHATKTPPASLQKAGGRAPRISTATAPDLVLVTSVDLIDLVREIPELSLDAKQQKALAMVSRRISVAPGTALAVFGDEHRMAARVPLRGRLGFKLSKRRIRRGLDELGQGVAWTDKDRFTMTVKSEALVGHVRRGEVQVASDTGLLTELIDGEGTPWLSDTAAEWLETYPVVVEARGLEELKLSGDQVVRLGLGATDDVWSMQIAVPEGLGKATDDAMQAVRERRGDPGFKMGTRSRPSKLELEENLNGIYIAELSYDAAFDEFIAAEPAPRAVGQLTPESVPWVSNAGFSKLGWMPDDQVRGTWWVEVSADGTSFTVFGAIDEDGDGVPAKIKREENGEIERLTPPEVR